MIMIDIEIWNEVKKEFVLFEALVDTGSTYCVIEKSIAESVGLKTLEVLHLWQMGDSLKMFQKQNLKLDTMKKNIR